MSEREWNMKKHYITCYNKTKHMFPGGFYSLPVMTVNVYGYNESKYFLLSLRCTACYFSA